MLYCSIINNHYYYLIEVVQILFVQFSGWVIIYIQKRPNNTQSLYFVGHDCSIILYLIFKFFQIGQTVTE